MRIHVSRIIEEATGTWYPDDSLPIFFVEKVLLDLGICCSSVLIKPLDSILDRCDVIDTRERTGNVVCDFQKME